MLGASRTQFERLYGKVNNLFVAAMCLDPETMWILQDDQRSDARRAAAPLLTQMKRRLFPDGGTSMRTAARAVAAESEYAMNLPGDDDTVFVPNRPQAVLGCDTAAFEQSLRELSRATSDHFRARAIERRREAGNAALNVSATDVYGTPVEFWVTMSAEFGADSIFGQLFPYAMAVLCVPATEAASERVFKAAKYAINADRPRLDSERGEQQVLVRRAIQARDLNARDIATTLRHMQ